MPLKSTEQIVCEAIDTMLKHKAKLGLQSPPKDFQQEEEHSFQYLHEQINDMFAIKAAGLTHHDGVCAAFRKIHNYKYITDPTFKRSVQEELKSQGIPKEECEKALEYIPAVLKELKKEEDWCERDAGWNPNLSEVLKASQPGVNEGVVRENCGVCEGDEPEDEPEPPEVRGENYPKARGSRGQVRADYEAVKKRMGTRAKRIKEAAMRRPPRREPPLQPSAEDEEDPEDWGAGQNWQRDRDVDIAMDRADRDDY